MRRRLTRAASGGRHGPEPGTPWTRPWSATCPLPAIWRAWRVCPGRHCRGPSCATCCSPTAPRVCWRRSVRHWAVRFRLRSALRRRTRGGQRAGGHTTRAVSLAAAQGARCVSLAGMIPSLTGYGFDVLRSGSHPAAVTTGHAATVVAVVRTVHAALEATGRDLSDLDVAFAGLGSIGASSLELLLSLAARPPRRLLLCDVRGSGPRLAALGRRLQERGLAGAGGVEVAESERVLPDAVHGADLLVTAVSGATAVLDVGRLRPGAIVVDDSFPHCFDTERALTRMREHEDVLVLGGGLLHVGRTDRQVAEDLPALAAAGYLAQPWIEGTLASCRAESLLHAAGQELPLVHGLVDAGVSLAYWEAVERAGVSAAPLHLLGHTVGGAPAV
ncbi:hypothetical protein ACR6C2_44465 [Streptomyces sp. INA 01156]